MKMQQKDLLKNVWKYRNNLLTLHKTPNNNDSMCKDRTPWRW